jgi:hypothetical protein
MLEFRTQGFQGYSVKYSPFFDNRIAVAAAANYGLVGNGRLYVLELTSHGIVPLKVYWLIFHLILLQEQEPRANLLVPFHQLPYPRRPLRRNTF